MKLTVVFFLLEVVGTADVAVAFNNIDVAVLVGAMPRKEGMERKDLLKANAKIFQIQGKALNEHAKKTVKVSSIFLCLLLRGTDCNKKNDIMFPSSQYKHFCQCPEMF